MTTLTVIELDDVHDTAPQTHTKVRIYYAGIEVDFKGYGTRCQDEGYGYPVLIEIRNGVPHVLIWTDINNEDATHVISLEGAAESKRKPE